MMKSDLFRRPGVSYYSIEKLVADMRSSRKNYMLRVSIIPFAPMRELKVVWVYDQRVVFEDANGTGGYTYFSLSYEQVEYPPYSIACRGFASVDAQRLYLDDPKGRRDRQEKIEKERQSYIESHWRDFYDDTLRNMAAWQARQEEPPPYYLDEVALAQAARYQCAAIFYGEKAVCICAQTGTMTQCQISVDRLQKVISEYLMASRNPLKLISPKDWEKVAKSIRKRERRNKNG